jgi:hypothetical protein
MLVDPAGLEANADSLTVRGSEEVVVLADWMFHRIDKRNAHAEEVIRIGDEQVRLFPFKAGRTRTMMLEAATALRSTLDLQRIYVHERAGLLALRAPAPRMDGAAWLLRQIAGEGGEPTLKLEGPESFLRVYTLMLDERQLQELATITRSALDIRRLLTLPSWGRMVVRGTPPQMRPADWLIDALQKPADASYTISGSGEPSVKLFAFRSIDNLQELAVNVRKATGARRVFVQSSPLMLAVRGTPEQVAEAEKLLTPQR